MREREGERERGRERETAVALIQDLKQKSCGLHQDGSSPRSQTSCRTQIDCSSEPNLEVSLDKSVLC